ncbi:MAG TPA: glycoside hydrolase family 38 C-terminal domain-containing protein [Verrucomicrobiae bacterium]|nr:glycoside hydrolase family 38 C-terminal domain-containing protein [Verrucomicrobiae bacterium]
MKKVFGLLLSNCCLATALFGADSSEKKPAQPVDLAHAKNLYVIGYAHLDTQWRWTYPTTIQEYVHNTLEQNFPLLEKYPDYIFNFTGSRRYEFMQEYYPEGFLRVKKYVQAGRWYPGGSSVDENDANIPALESFIRQTLYGNHYFKREFGIQSEDYLLPDCFGFPASLPTIFTHEGLKGFSTQKLTWGSAIGIPFNIGTWVGPDGSSVIAALNPGGYGARVTEDLSKSEMWLNRINETGDKSGVFADYKYYGTGDRGGAPEAMSVDWIQRALASSGPVRVISARSDQIYKDISLEQAAKLPSYTGDLLLVNHSAGSLSSEAYMKRWNRQNEQLANAAESAATMAYWLGAAPYPQSTLYAGWDLVLGSQMHDIMPGTSLPKAYEYAWNDEVLALNQFADVAERSSAAVLTALDTSAQGVAVAVYNPLPIEREDAIEATLPFSGTVPDAVTAYDPQGNAVPTQILGRAGDSLRVLFIAKVPSVGYAIYDVRPAANSSAPADLIVTANSLENTRYKVSVDANGDIASIFDKSLNHELLSAPARLSFHTENPSAWPAWNMDWEDREKPARGYVAGAAQIRIVESGPARVGLEVKRTTENSTFTQEIRLDAGGDRVEIINNIDWRSSEASLKADFTFTAANSNAAFADKVGVSLRDNDKTNRFEMPLQQWMDLTDADGDYGVEVMSDSKYGSDKPDDHSLRLTLLYTPGTRGGYPDQGTQDQGRHQIVYALASHKGGWAEGRDTWQAERLNQPLRAFLPGAHPGIGRTFSFLTLNSDQVQIAAIKKAEDSDEIIVRLKELTGKPAWNLALNFTTAIESAREVNGQEEPIGKAVLKDGQLMFDMKPFSLRAFALKLAPPAKSVTPVTSEIVSLTYDTDAVSSRAKREDGAMNSKGWAYPAEMFPKEIIRDGVKFKLGPAADGKKNAVTAHGQTIKLPSTNFNRVHLLVAADGDTADEIKIGGTVQPFIVPDWTGFIGQWDNRLWDNSEGKRDFEANKPPTGLVPGFIKRTPVAWFATHHNTPEGDAYYNYSYLFEITYDLPAGTKNLTLPDDSKIRVFALSVAGEPAATPPAAPLYDTLADHQRGGAPIIPQAGKSFAQATAITLLAPLYHQPGDLHYTLDGSDPNANSPVYDQPFMAEDTVKVAVAQIDEHGQAGEIVRGTIEIHDLAPPTVVSGLVENNQKSLKVVFSKPLDPATATDVKNYVVQPPLPVSQAALSADGRKVTLTFASPIPADTDLNLNISEVKDKSTNGNVIVPVALPFNVQNVVYSLKSAQLPADNAKIQVPGLPLKKNDTWTLNLLVKPESAVTTNRILIAGFGQRGDNRNGGTGRYFTAFDGKINFGAGRRGVQSGSPLESGSWQMLTATYDGKTLSIYKNGDPIGIREMELANDAEPYVNLGSTDASVRGTIFNGKVQAFTIRRNALTDDEVKRLYAAAKPVP